MRIAACLLALAPLLLAADGQGPVDSGPIQIQDLNIGTYWYGARITNKDLIGKVVLVETWGS